MRRFITVAGASAVLTLAAACAQHGSELARPAEGPSLSTSAKVPPAAEGQPASPGAAGERVNGKAPAGGQRVAAAQVNGNALPADYPRKVWTLHDGQTLAAYGQRGSCSTVRLEVVSQTDKQVRLRFVEKQPDPNRICTMELHQEPVTTPLKTPLGDRELVLDLAKV